MVWCIVSFLPVLLLEVVGATTYPICPTMETFRHCQIQANKTILGSRHVVLQGHCSGRIAFRIGFVVATESARARQSMYQHC